MMLIGLLIALLDTWVPRGEFTAGRARVGVWAGAALVPLRSELGCSHME